jgi:hypothetical protein
MINNNLHLSTANIPTVGRAIQWVHNCKDLKARLE